MNGAHGHDEPRTNGLTNGHLESTMNYWQEYLQGMEQCRFPTLSKNPPTEVDLETIDLRFNDGLELLEFCERENISLINVIQLAWAIILKCYTGDEEVCFGYTTEERNLLIARLDLAEQPVARDLLQKNERTLAQSAINQRCPLGKVYQSLGFPGTVPFNSLVTSCKAPEKEILLQLEEHQQTQVSSIPPNGLMQPSLTLCSSST